MAGPVATRFMQALQSAEAIGDPRVVASLFTDDAELLNLTAHGPRRGRDGATRFWEEYLHSFGQIRSHFGNVVEADGTVVVEWTSDGSLPDGRPVRYRGVSILETVGDRIRRFRSYYDTAALHPTSGGGSHSPARGDEWAPDAVRATPDAPGGTSVEEINRQTLPRAENGRLVDPKQDEVRDTAG